METRKADERGGSGRGGGGGGGQCGELCKAWGMKHRLPHKMIMLLNEIWQHSCKRLIRGSPAAMQMQQMSAG